MFLKCSCHFINVYRLPKNIITPNDSNLIDSVQISDCMSNHMCLLDRFNYGTDAVVPDTPISFRQYHKIDMLKFKHELLNSELLRSHASSLDPLYDQYSTVWSNLVDIHARLKIQKKFLDR